MAANRTLSNSTFQCHLCAVPPPRTQLCGPAPTHTNPGHGMTQDWKEVHRTFNMTQCLLTPATVLFLCLILIVTGTQNVMYGKILLGSSILIRSKVPALLTSIQPDKRRCSHNSLSDICWEYITVKVKLVICLQIDTFSSRCKWC